MHEDQNQKLSLLLTEMVVELMLPINPVMIRKTFVVGLLLGNSAERWHTWDYKNMYRLPSCPSLICLDPLGICDDTEGEISY
jgi:hypothetical protein